MRYAPRGRYAFSLPRRDREETLDFHFLLCPPGGSGGGERRRRSIANATIPIVSRVSRARALITPPSAHQKRASAARFDNPPDPAPDYPGDR